MWIAIGSITISTNDYLDTLKRAHTYEMCMQKANKKCVRSNISCTLCTRTLSSHSPGKFSGSVPASV